MREQFFQFNRTKFYIIVSSQISKNPSYNLALLPLTTSQDCTKNKLCVNQGMAISKHENMNCVENMNF